MRSDILSFCPAHGVGFLPVHSFCCDLLGIGSVVQGIGSVVNGSMQAKAQKDANATNLQIAHDNNIANQQLQASQNAWNLEQWNRENDYNSASSQRSRLEAAGLNPYMMMNGGDAGSASSLTSAPYTPSQQVSVSPVNYAQGISDAVNGFLNTQMLKANVKTAEANALKATAEANKTAAETPWVDKLNTQC